MSPTSYTGFLGTSQMPKHLSMGKSSWLYLHNKPSIHAYLSEPPATVCSAPPLLLARTCAVVPHWFSWLPFCLQLLTSHRAAAKVLLT